LPNRIERTSALPVDLYRDQAIYEMELAEIWHADWVFATTSDAVADPGDFVPVVIGEQSIIVVRGDDYQIRAFANACSHRGSPLIDCPGSGTRFTCPYHGWTYDTAGALVSVPYANPDELRRTEFGLPEVLVHQWQGLIFVCLNPQVEAFDVRVSTIDPYVRQLGLQRLVHDVPATSVERWFANWKIVFANAVDTYSQFKVHSETIEPFSPTDAAYYLAGSARATVTGGEALDRADHSRLSRCNVLDGDQPGGCR